MMAKVVDIVFIRGGKALLVQQRKESAKGLWSFPGGQVEADESIEEALLREVDEELSVSLDRYRFNKKYAIKTKRGELEIHSFVGTFDGEITLNDDELMGSGWFSLDELKAMQDELRSLIVLDQVQDALKITESDEATGEYEINEKDIESVIRYLKIHDPDNATPEKAISMLEDMQAGFHMLEHTNPELLDKLYEDVKRKDEN